MMWGNDGGWIVMWIWMALLWVGVIVGAVWLVRSLRGDPGNGADAHEILNRRLAGGDIDIEEHRKLSAELGGSGRGTSGERRIGLLIVLVAMLGFMAMATTAALTTGWDGWNMHGGGRNTSDSTVVEGGAEANVTIEGFAFEAGNLEVPVGATVTWTNQDSAPHDATARNGDWKTARLSDDESDTLTFTSAGTFDYYCSIHPSMKARLVVR